MPADLAVSGSPVGQVGPQTKRILKFIAGLWSGFCSSDRRFLSPSDEIWE